MIRNITKEQGLMYAKTVCDFYECTYNAQDILTLMLHTWTKWWNLTPSLHHSITTHNVT
jgi:hypothetical protein